MPAGDRFFYRAPVTFLGANWDAVKADYSNIHQGIDYTADGTGWGLDGYTITHAWLEHGPSGVCVPLLFDGQRGRTIAAMEKHVRTSEVTASAFGLSTFLGSQFYICTLGLCTAGARHMFTHHTGYMWTYNAAQYTKTPDTPGDMPYLANMGAVGQYGLMPILIGRTTGARKAVPFPHGDSLLDSFHTSPLIIAAVADGSPALEYSCGGARQSWNVQHPEWMSYMQYADWFADEMGVNDSGNTTDLAAIWAVAKQTYGHQLVAHIGGTPRSTSTDNYATAAGQTATPGHLSVLRAFWNAKVADGTLAASHLYTSVRDPGNFDLWLTNGTPNYTAADGLHYTEAALYLQGNEAKPWVAALNNMIV